MTGNHILLLCLFGISAYLVVNTVGHEAIIRGTLVRRANQFPYQVSVQVNDNYHICGGAIIGDYHVLTAARCFLNVNGYFEDIPVSVVAGTNHLNHTETTAVRIKVKKIFVLAEFRNVVFTPCDIAVLMLNHSLGLQEHNRHLRKLKLPTNASTNYTGESAVVSGFGWSWYNHITHLGGSDGQLRFADTLILGKNSEEYNWSTDPIRQICAKIKQVDHIENAQPRGVCTHDFGSPLVHDNTVIGVNSRYQTWPSKCSEKEIGAIYTRVSYFLKFIEDSINYSCPENHTDIRVFEPRN